MHTKTPHVPRVAKRLLVAAALALPAMSQADCHWEVRGRVQDQTGVVLKGKPVQLWSQLGSGTASDPQLSGPRETGWAPATTDAEGRFTARTRLPFPAASCTRSRIVGGTIGNNRLDLGLYGPFGGPTQQGSVHVVEVGSIGPGASADEVR